MWKEIMMGSVLSISMAASQAAEPKEQLPRKVIVGTIMHRFSGDESARYADVRATVAQMAAESKKKYPGRRLDLVLTTECAVNNGTVRTRGNSWMRTVKVEDIVKNLGPVAKEFNTYLVVGAIFDDAHKKTGKTVPRNGVIFLDRQGKLAGIYRKVHTALDWDDPDPQETECGIIPGSDFPVFDCDFGKVGFLVCYDMSYPDGWAELKKNGAEIVCIPTASPQTFRPAMFAHIHQYYVVTCPPCNNATVIDPLGFCVGQVERQDQPLVCEIDLSYAILHWSATLKSGHKFTDRYGDKAGFRYKDRENNGIFWSNDPDRTIGSMVRELKLNTRDDSAAQARTVQDKVRD